ncbi:MAG: cytochrome c oxidase subunit II [Gammaproteobacteria bacterium]
MNAHPARASALFAALAALILLAHAPLAAADWALNLPRGVTEISREVYAMHMMVLWICAAIGVVVFGVMAYSIVRHRKSVGAKPAGFSHSTLAEILWTIVPFFILVAMAIPAAKTLIKMEDAGGSELTVKITGHQWKWEYEYPDYGIRFFSNLGEASRKARELHSGIAPHSVPHYLLEVDKPMVLPVQKKVRFLLTSNDVLHAWWVPDFAVKKDAVPGFIREMWTLVDEPGTYRGQCAELCGRDHGFMPVVVEAVSNDEFTQWVAAEQSAAAADAGAAEREWSMAELMERGQSVYATNCAACHQADGQGIPGAFPALDASKLSLQAHLDIVLNGRAATAMQAFGAQLSDADIAAVVTYERNAWGNDSGDVVQPAAVKAGR